MPLNWINRLRQSTGIRLTIGFSAIFMFGYILLFFISARLLTSTIREKEQTLITTKISQYAKIEQESDYDTLIEVLNREAIENATIGLFIRVVGESGVSDLVIKPNNWGDLGDDLDDWVLIPMRDIWFFLKHRHQDIGILMTSQILSNDALLQVGRLSREKDALLTNFRDLYYRFMLPVFAISVLLGAILSSWTLKPIRDLARTVHHIITGKLDARVLVRRPKSDLGQLSTSFNTMLERNDLLIQGMNQTLDNVAHDIRTPLARMKADLEMALQTNDYNTRENTLVNCADNVEEMGSIVNAYMDITRAESGTLSISLTHVSIEQLIDDIIGLYEFVAEEKGIRIEKQSIPDLHLQADEAKLRRLLANLLDNAIKYSPENTVITIRALRNDDTVILEIRDQGAGIATEDLRLIFDRLYRVDKSRSNKGLGLGLSIVKAIATAHGAEVEVKSQLNEGSTFRVIFRQNEKSESTKTGRNHET